MQTEIRHQQLQPAILILQSPQSPRLAHVHTAVLLLPQIERGRAHTMLPADIPRLHPSLMLLQIPIICSSVYRLFFIFRPLVQSTRKTPASTGSVFRGQVRSTVSCRPSSEATFEGGSPLVNTPATASRLNASGNMRRCPLLIRHSSLSSFSSCVHSTEGGSVRSGEACKALYLVGVRDATIHNRSKNPLGALRLR